MPRPICFMVMPYRTKPTQAGSPAPANINFDSLWEKALRPAIEALGYQAIRADQDLGALIIHEMLERLYFSDLVIADMTIPNGNVYYEVGIRHAARNAGCVLISADWSKALFDIDQMRRIVYPLPEQEVSDAIAAEIRQKLADGVPALAQGVAPMFQVLRGYPGAVDPKRAAVIKDFVQQLSNFQAQVEAVRASPSSEQKSLALALRDQFANQRPIIAAVALEILYLLRDFVGWAETLAYIDSLPKDLTDLLIVKEQRCLAVDKTGNTTEAIGALKELIATSGATSERYGMLGGRYKKLSRDKTATPNDKLVNLGKAIESYEKGMNLDLNDYYSSGNLPLLYRERGRRGDENRATATAQVARMACERSLALNPNDPWVRPTLLGMAFFAGDATAAEELGDRVASDGVVKWKLDTTLADLETSLGRVKEPETKARLQAVFDGLKSLM
ncbi:MAG: tetratricopeptide repeat-containing protein [Chthoniobacter sp.]|uniref:tetratricopeptide repeat-containing protein n=1 Tax=Chthoniobacter sp. TaxID=2510640 RepID=UPI0032A632A9